MGDTDRRGMGLYSFLHSCCITLTHGFESHLVSTLEPMRMKTLVSKF
jgi:hypothetical protein